MISQFMRLSSTLGSQEQSLLGILSVPLSAPYPLTSLSLSLFLSLSLSLSLKINK